MVRRHVSFEEREEYYELLCSGFSMSAAAAGSGVSRTAAREWWRASGLVSPVVKMGRDGGLAGSPPVGNASSQLNSPPCGQPGSRLGGRRVLTSEDRAVISAGLRRELSYAEIGRLIGRHRSVVCREVARNRGPDGSYWSPIAHRAAHERRRRPKPLRLVANPGLSRQIEQWMDAGWSPRLIAAVLAGQATSSGSSGSMMGRVSHETIYQALYVQGRGSLRQDLHRQLSTHRARRKTRTGPAGTSRSHSPYRQAFTISQRPVSVEDRAVPGHWEGDLVLGTGCRSAVGTLVERSTRFTMLLHLPADHGAEAVAAAMIREMSQLPEHLRRSLTWDRGVELARYDKIQLDLSMPVYFCDPYSPWQRGTNENTNRLLRHWLTKGSDLSRFTAADLRKIAATLNARPRPTLNMQTPAQALDQLLTTPAAA